jgi:hypothetical protein
MHPCDCGVVSARLWTLEAGMWGSPHKSLQQGTDVIAVFFWGELANSSAKGGRWYGVLLRFRCV